MLDNINSTIQNFINLTWPMIVISVVVLVSMRITYLVKNKEKLVLYKELLMLSFIIYILFLFQIVTFQDDVTWSTNNFIPFKEILRYNMGSRLFMKNVLGNLVLFLPYGFFVSYYLRNDKPHLTILLTLVTSFAIEIVQLLIGRVFDIDDILLNLLGGFIGYLIYHYLHKFWEKMPAVFRTELFLNMVSVIILLIIIALI